MIFALFVGVVLGLLRLDTPIALLALTFCLGAKLVADIRWERLPYLGTVSPYTVYCYNLAQAGEPTDSAWFSYALQLLLFGGLLGGGAYALVRYLT